ncbi:MAG: 16S rRNA (guanine(527)-N(7))-methyltransferase RsmG [Candidatus Zixiibacteriota bacterium]|nr:MAG: 16S rRNA (guanine(527)-N(7))-methyltransferase RsmG [candidate division Zixibacteria bacterium]
MPLPDGSESIIKKWLVDHHLETDSVFIQKVELYHDLLLEWSLRINLVSKKDLGDLLERHILDSLVPIREIPMTGDLVDMGSGAGFPAIPIALVRPKLDIVMIESRRKKAIFLDEAISRLDLTKLSIWNGRLEEFSPTKKCDIVTIRGVAISEKIENRLRRIVKQSGKIIYYNRFGEYRLI